MGGTIDNPLDQCSRDGVMNAPASTAKSDGKITVEDTAKDESKPTLEIETLPSPKSESANSPKFLKQECARKEDNSSTDNVSSQPAPPTISSHSSEGHAGAESARLQSVSSDARAGKDDTASAASNENNNLHGDNEKIIEEDDDDVDSVMTDISSECSVPSSLIVLLDTVDGAIGNPTINDYTAAHSPSSASETGNNTTYEFGGPFATPKKAPSTGHEGATEGQLSAQGRASQQSMSFKPQRRNTGKRTTSPRQPARSGRGSSDCGARRSSRLAEKQNQRRRSLSASFDRVHKVKYRLKRDSYEDKYPIPAYTKRDKLGLNGEPSRPNAGPERKYFPPNHILQVCRWIYLWDGYNRWDDMNFSNTESEQDFIAEKVHSATAGKGKERAWGRPIQGGSRVASAQQASVSVASAASNCEDSEMSDEELEESVATVDHTPTNFAEEDDGDSVAVNISGSRSRSPLTAAPEALRPSQPGVKRNRTFP